MNAKANYRGKRLGQLGPELEEAALRIEQQDQARVDTLNNIIQTLESSLDIVTRAQHVERDVVWCGSWVELLKLNRDVVKLKGDIASSRVAAQKTDCGLPESIADHRSIALGFSCQQQGQLNEAVKDK